MKNDAEIAEFLLIKTQGTANFLRGMILDPSIPNPVKEAIAHKVNELDEIVNKYAKN